MRYLFVQLNRKSQFHLSWGLPPVGIFFLTPLDVMLWYSTLQTWFVSFRNLFYLIAVVRASNEPRCFGMSVIQLCFSHNFGLKAAIYLYIDVVQFILVYTIATHNNCTFQKVFEFLRQKRSVTTYKLLSSCLSSSAFFFSFQ